MSEGPYAILRLFIRSVLDDNELLVVRDTLTNVVDVPKRVMRVGETWNSCAIHCLNEYNIQANIDTLTLLHVDNDVDIDNKSHEVNIWFNVSLEGKKDYIEKNNNNNNICYTSLITSTRHPMNSIIIHPYLIKNQSIILTNKCSLHQPAFTADAGSVTEERKVRIGLGVFLCHNNYPKKILIGRRKGSTGEGQYALPGGHLEYGETFEECAVREVQEETGLSLQNPHIMTLENEYLDENNKHYVTLFLGGDCTGKEENLEPDKCEDWFWCDYNNMPTPLFSGLKSLRDRGFSPFD